MKLLFLIVLGVVAVTQSACQSSTPVINPLETSKDRDYLKWFFLASGIWNMPLHNNAQYVDAPIRPSTHWGVAADENILILRPSASLKTVYVTTAGWDSVKTR